jgi:hypothetical protein
VADIAAGAKTREHGDCRYGEQDGSDRLCRSDPQRTIYIGHGLTEEEQRVSKARNMIVHRSAAKTKTPRRKSEAQLPAKL